MFDDLFSGGPFSTVKDNLLEENFNGKEPIQFSDKAVNKMGITESDYAVSAKGMRDYVDNLKAELIDKTYDKLKEISPIKDALDKGWNGPAKAAFLTLLEESINATYADMNKEHKDLLARLTELQSAYLQQNIEMAKTISGQE